MQRLKGKVAVVTGASRSIGRGIALVLGEEGATVYVTGRSTRGAPTRHDRPNVTIEATAEMVNARGGQGIPVCCDHTVDEQVEALFERLQQEQDRLDVLVNNAWDGYDAGADYAAPFWEQPLWRWEKQFTQGVRMHYTASRLAARLMIPHRQGLIVSTTWAMREDTYEGPPLAYDLAKTAISRLVYAMAHELQAHTLAALALSPGVPRNEYMIAPAELHNEYQIPPVVHQDWPADSFMWKTESTQYIGRAVAALASDPAVLHKSGRVLKVGDLAREYGFTDIDGRHIAPYVPEEHLTD